MRIVRGPRPWSIRTYCGLNFASGAFELIKGLLELDEWVHLLAESMPFGTWTQDDAIVLNASLFTIVLIPLVAIWFFASKIARALVTAFNMLIAAMFVSTAFKEPSFLTEEWLHTVYAIIMIAIVGLLYLPSANQWFAKEATVDPAVFE